MFNICKPNLPNNKVTTVIMSGQYLNLVDDIASFGINVITTKQHGSLPPSEGFHADMQCLHINDIIITEDNNYNLLSQLEKYNIKSICSTKRLQQNYPYNILFNCAVIDDKAFCKIPLSDDFIQQMLDSLNIEVVAVKQGYSKCSTVIVSKNAIITADESIYTAAYNKKFDVLKIPTGFVRLYGYDYGFLGGACSKINKDILAFCGKIENHPAYNDIKDFCANYSVQLLSLNNNELMDIGGILPILQK